MSRSATTVLLSCEHGGNDVPAEWAFLFRGPQAARALRGHRGFDAGALPVARRLAGLLSVPLVASTTTRLLVDLNRSPTNPRVFSEHSRCLDLQARARLLDAIHAPHRANVETSIRDALGTYAHVLHIAVHSFTPRLHGVERSADIGLLYDPARPSERSFCALLRSEILARHRTLRVRRNYPYRGTDDGLTTHLRRVFPDDVYSGVELEFNQRLLRRSVDSLTEVLAAALARVVARPNAARAG